MKALSIKLGIWVSRWYNWAVSSSQRFPQTSTERETVKLIPFELPRTAQAVAVLLKNSPQQRLTRMQLVKLLYIADRESLRLAGRPITGDKHVAMQHGPVLSHTLNLIKGDHSQSAKWQAHFSSVGNSVILTNDPGDGQLSNFDIKMLQGVAKKYRGYTAAQLRRLTHEFDEYKKNEPKDGAKVADIPLGDVLEALGQLDRKGKLEAEAAQAESTRRLFSAYAR